MRNDEVEGAPLSALDIGLPLEPIKPLIGNAFVEPDSKVESIVDAVNRGAKRSEFVCCAAAFGPTAGSTVPCC